MSKTIFSTTTPDKVPEFAGRYLVERIRSSEEMTLVLLSGGSAIDSYAAMVELISSGQADNLMVGLVDERFGSLGHAGSNAQAIAQRFDLWNLCKQHGVEARPILTHGVNLDDEVAGYQSWLRKALAVCPRRVGVMGIGSDGHTAGIFPQAPADFQRIFGDDLVVGYTIDQEYSQRITVTPRVISLLNEVIVVAVGANKRQPLLAAFKDFPVPEVCDVPSALLRTLPDVRVYTDQTLS